MTFDFEAACRDLTFETRISTGPMRVMRKLTCDIPPRPAGSEAMRQAQEFLEREWGFFDVTRITREEVSVQLWDEGATRVQVIAPAELEFAAIHAVNSAAGTVEAEVVDIGAMNFSECHQQGDAAEGAIPLMQGHVASGVLFEPIQKRIALAESMGASGVVLAGTVVDLPALQYLNRARIPVASISAGDAGRLRKLLGSGPVRLRLHTEGRAAAGTCRNLWGELRPEVLPTDELIIVCAHLDTFHLAPGAVDNSSGVATMTEVARALAPYRHHFRRALRIIAFTGEERGYAGSKFYVRSHEDELERTKFVFSMDCIFESTASGVAVMWAPELRDYIEQTLKPEHPEVDARDVFCMSSDYLPFILAGVPAARPADWHNTFPRWTHTVKDTSDKVGIDYLKTNAIVYSKMLLKMLTDPAPLPSRRKSREEVEALIEREGAADMLRWQVLLPS